MSFTLSNIEMSRMRQLTTQQQEALLLKNDNIYIEEYIRSIYSILSANINAIHVLEKNKEYIDWNILSKNINAISILEKNIDKIDWTELSKNINSDDEDEKYDPNNIKKRGQGPKINVRKTKY
jgi:hypothetical protein